MPIVPATRKAEVGGSHETGRQKELSMNKACKIAVLPINIVNNRKIELKKIF